MTSVLGPHTQVGEILTSRRRRRRRQQQRRDTT